MQVRPTKNLKSPTIGSDKYTDRLVSSASAGDRKAYESLYRDYFPKISRFVSFRVSHKETAEDLVAEIFVKAWESLQGSSEVSSFPKWLFTIARNRVIDHYRTKRPVADLFELENFLEYEDNIVNTIDSNIASRQFLEVLGELPPDQQQVIRLKFLEDLQNEEIAAIIEKTPGTIRVIQHRAIVALKKLLKQASSN